MLANAPETGTQYAPDSQVWVLPMALIGGRQATLYYTFDDETVWLISIVVE